MVFVVSPLKLQRREDVLFFRRYRKLRIVFLLVVLRVTHTAHRAVGATAAAGGFPLFLVAEQTPKHQSENNGQYGTNNDGSNILTQPFKHGKVLLSVGVIFSCNG